MNKKNNYICSVLLFANILSNFGWAQNSNSKSDLILTPFIPNTGSTKNGSGRSLPDLGENYLVLTPDLANASLSEGGAKIPFTVKNNSDKDIEIFRREDEIDGLATVAQDGKKRFIHEMFQNGWEFSTYSGPGPSRIILKPGEITSRYSSVYEMDILGSVTGKEIFGVISGRIVSTNKSFMSYSTPFLVPPALTTLPYNDLGIQTYLSITPDLTQVYFSGGNFKNTTIELQRADPKYADSIKNGWTEDVMIPFSVKNTSNQDLVVSINGIGYYIVGNEKGKNEATQGGGWYLIKLSTPIVKPNESISNDSQWKLSWLEAKGYKPGDKIVAVVGGRIPNTNKIFECYSAPFELPPLPKGEPPTPAGK